MVNYGADAIF